jgi:xanthine dehydrogenase small subunit
LRNSIAFVLDGKIVEIGFETSSRLTPTTTVLNYLRSLPNHRGVKEGCAEGDCGACTVVIGEMTTDRRIEYRAIDSCLLFLPMLHGKQLITIENLKSRDGHLHPVQRAMVEEHASQCGFCTPGIVMTLFALHKNSAKSSTEEIGHALSGNLCRCTGYRPIFEAAAKACSGEANDHFSSEEPHICDLLTSIPRKSVSIATDTQRYDQPLTLEESLDLLVRYPSAVIVNGATDVALRATKNFELLPHIIDCSRIEELTKVTADTQSVSIGAGVQINDMMAVVEKDFPALHEMLLAFGAKQIRNLATLGGNIATASPVGDTLPVLIAYGATILLQSRKGKRIVNVGEWVKGYRKTERRSDELIIAIAIPRPTNNMKIRSYKVSKRRDLDIATVSSAFKLEVDRDGLVSDIVLAYGGMADRPKRAAATEEFLKGKRWQRDVVEEAQRIIDTDFNPISDVRGSAEFRKIAARNLILKFWNDTVIA